MHRCLLAAVVAGCGSAPSTTFDRPEPLVFEPYSPPQFTSRDVFLAARGDIVVLAGRLSNDGGQTWEASPLTGAERVAIDGTRVAAYAGGLVRYDVVARTTTPVPSAPGYASPRTWRVTPAGRFVVFAPIANAIAFETATGFSTATLPQPSPTETAPYIVDLESNGTAAMTVSAWGVHRSIDGGATWERVLPPAATLGRELIALADGRFVLLGGSRTIRFDARGAMTGDVAGVTVGTEEAVACDDGAIVAGGKVSRDAGATWQPLLSSGDLALVVERVGCGGGRYWVLGHSASWGYRLLRYDAADAPGLVIGNWELSGAIAWTSAGPPILRVSDGTFIAAGLAWRDGEAAWTLRLAPPRAWASGPTLFGVADAKFFTSEDAGRTWHATTVTGLDDMQAEAFARSPDGALHVSRFVGNSSAALDEWHATVWRSVDRGATWTIAYDARATRVPGENVTGEAHRFVGINAAGDWIATDAISKDGGATWQPTEFEGDRSLAFLTPDGYLVTPRDDVWRVYEAGGTGDLRGTWELEADGQRIPASQLRSVAFDEEGHAYVARGTPYVQVWRSDQPIRRAR